MGRPKLVLQGLVKVYRPTEGGAPVTALDGVDLEVREGEFVCLLGPSGCGKTTLLRLAAGLERPTAGEVLLDGRPVRGPGPRLGMVFQDPLLFPWRRALENVAYGLEVRGLPAPERRRRALEALRRVGLEGFAHHYPRELSGGMRQRVALARVLVNEPEVLLMDEPFASVDAQTRADLQAQLLRLWAETGKTILFVTHSVEEALYLADRVVLMTPRPGRVRADLPVPLSRPRSRTSPEFGRLRAQVLDALGFPGGE